jgi:Condensation domain
LATKQHGSGRGVIQSAAFSCELTEQTKYLSRVGEATLFVILVAGFAALLHSYTEQTDFVIGTFSPSGRQCPELHRLLGHFISPVGLRLEPRDDLTFHELMQRACDVVGEAMKRDMAPLEALMQAVPGWPVSGRSRLFNVGISLQPPMPSIAYDWTITSMDAQSGGSPWDLYLAFIERPSGLMGRVQYDPDPDLLEESVITQMWSDFESLLKIAAARP